ncbi:MAG: MFS transporter, partial [Actinomycetota bacterium]|nr:MFS transporter [Actinomycetota bacterium]
MRRLTTLAQPSGEAESIQGWLVVAATFVSTATIFGITYSFGTFFKVMAQEFGADSSRTALMFGLTIFFLFVLGFPAGKASDRFGPRPVVLFGCFAIVTGLMLTSLVQSITVGYLTYGFGIGVGVACCYVPLVSQVSAWFDRRRAMALGFAVSGIGVGTLVASPTAAWLIRSHGWRETYRILAVVALIGLLLSAALVQRAPALAGATRFELRPVLASPVFRSMYLGGLLMSLSLFVPFVFLGQYAIEHGVEASVAAWLTSFLGLGSLGGRLILGLFVEKVGLLRLYQGCFATLAGSFFIWLGSGGRFAVLAVFAFVLGTSYGGYVALSPAASAQLFGLNGLGSILGALYTAGGLGGLIGPPVAGLIIDRTGRYEPAIITALLLGCASVVVLRRAIAA